VLPVNQVLVGDSVNVMKGFPEESIDMVMFSPPYYGLRNYGEATETVWGGEENCSHEWIGERMILVHENRNFSRGTQEDVRGDKPTTYIKKYDDRKAGFCVKCGAWKGQLGLEPSWQMYVAHMGEVCRELKRVLKKTGSMYIVLGDTYAGSHCGKGDKRLKPNKQKAQFLYEKPSPQANITDYQPKCLIGIPWRVAFALIDDGWVLRERIVWHKGNAMPGSQKDRLTQTCEMIFHFVKNTGKALLWRNELTSEWLTERPKQVYFHVETRELRDECQPKEERYAVDEFGSRHLVWKPLWRGFDYYYELDAIREAPKSLRPSGNKARKPSLQPNGKGHVGRCIPWIPFKNPKHPLLGKNLGNVTSERVKANIEHFVPKGSGGHYAYGGLDSKEGKHDHPSGKNPGDVFQTNKKPYVGNDPHRMRLKKEQYLALDSSRPMDLSHPKGKNPGDVVLTKHDLAVNRVGNLSYTDPLHVKAYNIRGKNPGDVIKWANVPGQAQQGNFGHGGTHGNLFNHPDGKNPGDFWSISTKPFKGAHFAVYPEAICVKPILSSCPHEGIILDPMCESGTTLAIAKKLGRRYIGIEINPKYVSIANERLLTISPTKPLIS